MSSDGIAGFKGSLERVFPRTQSQRCVVHLVRNIYSLCPKKEAKNIIADYKKIYTSTSLEYAELELDNFKNTYSKDYSRIVKKTQDFMQYLEPLFELPDLNTRHFFIGTFLYQSNINSYLKNKLQKTTFLLKY